MLSIDVSKQKYSNRKGVLRNQKKISECSMTVDRQVIEDNRNARYLIEENIRSDVNFDLKKGLESFIYKGDSEIVRAEPRLYSLCHWAVVREGKTLNEVFEGVDFASFRGTFKRMAATIMTYNPNRISEDRAWTVYALKFDNVILLSEERVEDGNSSDINTYSGFKFEQYMTSDRQNGTADTESLVDNRESYKIIVKSQLVSQLGFLNILCGAEIDAVRGDEPIELKTSVAGSEYGFYSLINKILQTEIAGVRSIVFGLKTDKTNIIVDKVMEKSVSDLRTILNASNPRKTPQEGQCYAFLSDILIEVKRFMKERSVCRIRFDPYNSKVKIESTTKDQAKERGHVVPQEFLDKFNLDF